MPKTADEYNDGELAAGTIQAHHVTTLTRLWQLKHSDLLEDGKCGPKTRSTLWPDEVPIIPIRRVSEPADQDDIPRPGVAFEGPLESIPTSRTAIYALFGHPGTKAKPNRKWRKANIITVRDMPGVPRKWHFKVHRLAEPYMREGLRRAMQLSEYVIDRAGCFVLRHIRHKSKNPLSLHSWGIAVDFDSDRNGARKVPRGQAPRPWSTEWLRLWPEGLDQGFVEGMESVGFTWGGVWGRSGGDFAKRAERASYLDPMHFELRLRG